MEIITAFKTSQGTFLDFQTAMQKKNRPKIYGSRVGDVEREEVVEVYLLHSNGKYFELKSATVNSTPSDID